ncbi:MULTISPECIES: Asp-tRNA(Asn)/Glu-tRNA(Gln) amidotransferase subunit GatA [Clostridium]|uniref:Glutamyl-tRNA(Gln) amidotransferase subunit A n=3 Tax=Clostridium TaxID=1485 RepID=D8GTB9_CLOLD|nr:MULTISPECIES: Asp-tRNA(Asn)/Glu-tRNA(Gln) amidotransferase subunit GatA [Clostridium]ADK16718.1 glutamyl-tRNA amidotransferase, subunit A [Clostridium ljungdahlii DSM 13528]AGY75776.1 Asp-tRNA(Asn)/Glu-tRNA(Gln) amidotransferase subunit GatA [Clostridium autoethanogenum DSM 10061]ALU35941.1 Glutamyl-tRNA(Gln) amidotransferase subunit A [Clostridium autoethanogenum DSM 10061]OAA89406.1 Glutamyl-tRNA(Gln) amidotransferase subunit A [Clostridium ljungdahlii DSM 13528]OVY52001.1 Glutamyl-tRNA(G
MKLTAHEIRNMLKNKEISVEEIVRSYLNRINKFDTILGAYLYVEKEGALKRAKDLDKKIKHGEKMGGLFGIPISIKDNISVKGMQNSCASKMLQGYISPYDASVIKRIEAEDGIIIGKANMDEFAMGSSNEKSAFKLARNPWDLSRVPGGSSGGSAVSVSAGESVMSLGTDTGGSVRQPACLCGVVGLKPTYGRVSRYGAVAFASTLDQIGLMSADIEDCACLTQCIAGSDKNDFTTVDMKVPDYSKSLTKDIKGMKIGIPKEYFEDGLDDRIRKSIEEAVDVLKANGAEVKECSIPLVKYSMAVYYVIASAEVSSNLARFDGIRYGYRSKNFKDYRDLYFKSRSEALGMEVKRRIMLGTYMLSKGYYDEYYEKALKVRNLIKNQFEEVMKEFDALIAPTSPTTAFKIGEKKKNALSMYLSDVYVLPANVSGMPAISVPCGMVDGLPVGFQIMTNYYREDTIFNIAYSFEQSTNWHKMSPQISEV